MFYFTGLIDKLQLCIFSCDLAKIANISFQNVVVIYECPTLALSLKTNKHIPLTSKVLGSNGESEGRSILGFCSGAGFGAAGMQGYGGPSLGWATGEGDFLMEDSLLGAIPNVLDSQKP